jgi:hypothetical protein
LGIKGSKITYLKEKTMKKLFGTGIIATLVVVLASGWAYANGGGNTILFPYINSNPGNLSTIISVINTASKDICPEDVPHMLHYRYMTKLITASNMDYCDESDFCRPTTKNDIVTFDVAGQIESGKAILRGVTSWSARRVAPAAQNQIKVSATIWMARRCSLI